MYGVVPMYSVQHTFPGVWRNVLRRSTPQAAVEARSLPGGTLLYVRVLRTEYKICGRPRVLTVRVSH